MWRVYDTNRGGFKEVGDNENDYTLHTKDQSKHPLLWLHLKQIDIITSTETLGMN